MTVPKTFPGDAGGGSVLHFAADWLPASEVFVYDLVRHLRRPGVVVAANPLENGDRFPLPGTPVRSLTPLYRAVRPRCLHRSTATTYLRLLCARRGVDVLHAHHGYGSDLLVDLARRGNVPLVVSLHGHDVTGYLEEHPEAYRRVRAAAAAVVVPSRFLAARAITAGFDPASVRVLPSGVDTSLFVPTPLPGGPPTALFVGRFVGKKGIDTLAAAWPSVLAAVPDARLVLLGYGPLDPLARSIPGDVEVRTAPGRLEVRDAMRGAHLVVSPSHRATGDAFESLLMVNLEAQASGRAVVTTRHGGIPEYVSEGESAIMVPEGDPAALAAALVSVLTDRGLATRLGAAGPASVAGLDVRRTAARMDALYDELARPLPATAGSGARTT